MGWHKEAIKVVVEIMRVKVGLSFIKWLRFITTKMLNGNQHTVKTITTVTIILIICKNRKEESQSYYKLHERVLGEL